MTLFAHPVLSNGNFSFLYRKAAAYSLQSQQTAGYATTDTLFHEKPIIETSLIINQSYTSKRCSLERYPADILANGYL